jgi:RNA polymerase primary sigma factor
MEATQQDNLNQPAELAQLIERGKAQGYLTYDEVNQYLPDEANDSVRLNRLLVALEQHGIRLQDQPTVVVEDDTDGPSEQDLVDAAEDLASLKIENISRNTTDPIRMYLSQMAEIPLLTREEEISLAKKIEITRRQFPPCLCLKTITPCGRPSTRCTKSTKANCRSIARSRSR